MFSFIALLVAAASAQQAINQITNPGANSVIQAGGGVQTISWSNASPGNVSISLFSGANPVVEVIPITTSVVNIGTYLWNPETFLPSGNDYTIGITDLSGNNPVQYSPYFTIQLCSTCSSSTRSTTSSFDTQTVSVAGLDLGTRTQIAFPALASAAQTSGVDADSGRLATATASATSAVSLSGTAIASLAASLGDSRAAVLSMTAGNSAISSVVADAASSQSSDARSGASKVAITCFLGLVGAFTFVLML